MCCQALAPSAEPNAPVCFSMEKLYKYRFIGLGRESDRRSLRSERIQAVGGTGTAFTSCASGRCDDCLSKLHVLTCLLKRELTARNDDKVFLVLLSRNDWDQHSMWRQRASRRHRPGRKATMLLAPYPLIIPIPGTTSRCRLLEGGTLPCGRLSHCCRRCNCCCVQQA
jgi:hypothetical protein